MSEHVSAAALRLRAAVTPSMSQAELARKLGVSAQAVSAWLSGAAMPRPEKMAQIESLLGIPMRAWTEQEESAATPVAEPGAT